MPIILKSDAFYLSAGQVENIGSVKKFGRNAAVGTTQVLVAPQSGDFNTISAAATLYASSSDDGDDQSWEFNGLDSNYKLQTLTKTLVGQTKTALPGSWIRIFRAKNLGATDNAGDVYVYEDETPTAGVPQIAGNIQLKVPIGYNQTVHACYTIPDDFQFALLKRWDVFSGKDAISTTFFKVREFGGVFQTKFIRDFYRGGSVGNAQEIMLKIPAKADIIIEAISTASTTPIGSEFDLILVNQE